MPRNVPESTQGSGATLDARNLAVVAGAYEDANLDHGGEVRMKIQTMRKLAALLTGAALALSFPVASSVADAGGVPNSHSKPCKQKGEGTTKTDPTPGKGKKCGFHKS